MKKGCGLDGRDCLDPMDYNKLQIEFPNCNFTKFAELGDGFCDTLANNKECGYDDGECLLQNTLPNCNLNNTFFGDGFCNDLYDTKEFSWDLGDCNFNLQNISIVVYPNCNSLRLGDIDD